MSLTITAFFAALGVGTLLWGPFADRYGRKPVMYAALGAVVVGAVLSSFAPTFEVFLVGRVLWGIAAAGPRTIVLAMTRDSYEGDAMARIMSLTLAVFLVVPILAPALGELLLLAGSWRLTTMMAAVMSIIGAIWFTRVEETLNPEDQLPLEFGRVAKAAKAVVTTRQTALFTIAATMTYGSFFPWLGSSPVLIGEIYDRESQFALIFAVNATFMAITILIVERLVQRYSTYPVILAQAGFLIITSAVYVVVSLTSDGVPSFFLWFILVSIMTALNSSTSPLQQAMAMEPMGAIAGTAASVTGAAVFLGGAVLGSIIDATIDDTVTPFGVGFLVFGAVMTIAIIVAGRSAKQPEPATSDLG